MPRGSSAPIAIEDYQFSADGRRVLIFTNSAARLAAEHARRLLGARPRRAACCASSAARAPKPSTLDVREVLARRRTRGVRAREQSLRRGPRERRDHAADERRLAHDHQRHLRLGVRGRARICATASAGAPTASASRTGSSTTSGVRDFLLIDDTDSLYSFTIPVQYPKAGTTNSAARVGVVSASGRRDAMDRACPATRATTTSRAWIGPRAPMKLVLQQLNRRQNTLHADARQRAHRRGAPGPHGARQRVGRRGERCALARRRASLHLGERARRLASALRQSRATAHRSARSRRATFDLQNPDAAVRRARTWWASTARRAWIYFTASPDARDAALPVSRRGSTATGHAERVTPATAAGHARL